MKIVGNSTVIDFKTERNHGSVLLAEWRMRKLDRLLHASYDIVFAVGA